MFLDTVNINGNQQLNKIAAKKPSFAEWEHMPYTCISHHGSACCESAKTWFISMDYSLLNGSSPFTGPRWIRHRYEWGPTKHPIHWCEAVREKTLDCGALAWLAHECFKARGVKSFPTQLVQQYSSEATGHWANKWADRETSTHWIKDDVIYHEGCTIFLPDGTVKIWDASAAWWMNPEQVQGYGSLISLRIHANVSGDTTFKWGRHQLQPNKWENVATLKTVNP